MLQDVPELRGGVWGVCHSWYEVVRHGGKTWFCRQTKSCS